MSIDEEKILVERCLEGNKQSWDEFVRKYTKLIYNSIYRTLELKGYKVDPDLVEDLHQEVFLLLLKNNFSSLRKFEWKRNCSLATWIGVLTRNLVLNFVRTDSKKRYKTKSLDDMLDEKKSLIDIIEDESPSFTEALDKDIIGSELKKHIEELDVDERMILGMFYIQDLPLKEIARILGKSEDAVFMQKKRVIAKLNEKIKKHVGF